AGEAQPREAADQRADSDLRLQPRQRSSQAEVDATAERQVGVGLTAQVEALRVAELCLVTVGRAEQGDEHVSGFDLLTTHLEVRRSKPETCSSPCSARP